MAVANPGISNSAVVPSETSSGLWLRSRNWDLMFITMSVIFVPLPYLVYLLAVRLGMSEDVSRNLVNGFVAIAIGGPHMMSTFLRTGLDKDFNKRLPDAHSLVGYHSHRRRLAGVPQSAPAPHHFLLLGSHPRSPSDHLHR